MELTIARTRRYLSRPTKGGCVATDEDIVNFMMLCKARALDPWVGDAFLVGFDSQDGPQFSLITSLQALLKRAELNPNFRGFQYGVVVIPKKAPEGEIVAPTERQGSIVLDREQLVGGWARVLVDGHEPFYNTVQLGAFSKPTKIWKVMPGWMIGKCALAASLRQAFPSQCGNLYTSDEMGATIEGAVVLGDDVNGDDAKLPPPSKRPEDVTQGQLDDLKRELEERQKAAAEEQLPTDLSQPPGDEGSDAEEEPLPMSPAEEIEAESPETPPGRQPGEDEESFQLDG